MRPHLLEHKKSHFVLWRPRVTSPVPQLVIGTFQRGNPPTLADSQVLPLQQSPLSVDLWERNAAECNLTDGVVYHYWFRVRDGHPQPERNAVIDCTDPTAEVVDWRLRSTRLPPPYSDDDCKPAVVVKYANGRLLACDPAGEVGDLTDDAPSPSLPPNNRLVIYELPTRWSRTSEEAGVEVGVGTFRDVMALVEAVEEGANFAGLTALRAGRAHLRDLGVNALEPLPPADSFVDREWGYATSNYFAADFDLGFPDGHSSPTASSDFARLIRSCHRHGIRFFYDAVMAFSTRGAYNYVNFLDFFVLFNSGDPEQDGRDGFGGDLFKYNYFTQSYDPISGGTARLVPARELMKAHIARWILDFHIDGIRMDSVVNIMNYDFVQQIRDYARDLWRARGTDAVGTPRGAEERFLVVGEELAVPMALLEQNRLDGLWNEHFKRILRNVILGRNDDQEPSFEWSVRKLIDCRLLGFRDGAQAVNYITSHDVGGFRNERLHNYLQNNRIVAKEKWIKLAFVCLLTAVGIPMILAGEEFADEHDHPTTSFEKQVDPVNFSRLEEPWRAEIFRYVARLVRLRTTHDALAVNDTEFIHVDFQEGKRVLVWRRGSPQSGRLVVVVANFSDWGTPDPASPRAEYVVRNWPGLPAGARWKEITQDRDVPAEWAGREPIYPWEAKVYAVVLAA